ncbi:MAG: hypothetical protein WAL41_22680, partial [Mycobacterium sp.]
MTVELAPITDADVAAVADFLHAKLIERVPRARSYLVVPWKVEPPNRGFMVRDGQHVVGAYLAFYSERLVAGRMERFCNLGACYVLPVYGFHSVRLLKALLAKDGYHRSPHSRSGCTPDLQGSALVGSAELF